MNNKFTSYEEWTNLPLPDKLLGFDEARSFVHNLNLKPGQWKAYTKGEINTNVNGEILSPLPSNIPVKPWKAYKGEYKGAEDWTLSPKMMAKVKKDRLHKKRQKKAYIESRRIIEGAMRKHKWSMCNETVWDSLFPYLPAEKILSLFEEQHYWIKQYDSKQDKWRAIKKTILKDDAVQNREKYDDIDSPIAKIMWSDIIGNLESVHLTICPQSDIPLVFGSPPLFNEVIEYRGYQNYLKNKS